ncbi:uncharacterized protein BDZ99DRAFT_481424 [Mytilinidion resinicola]|uniref:Uncharacterized protein n=1 Tax=Mytilinidion resinicola TaxID=574789 RepID=A0A6A6Y645_9PEZI|nr:uncharacterized protein BDZ99DRAFT_481424 [Mytilinidion resinicola]KAF2804272.1 hypothetical protein BDZ99DRAFT_481424 [Mytilinidion resinicola]
MSTRASCEWRDHLGNLVVLNLTTPLGFADPLHFVIGFRWSRRIRGLDDHGRGSHPPYIVSTISMPLPTLRIFSRQAYLPDALSRHQLLSSVLRPKRPSNH